LLGISLVLAAVLAAREPWSWPLAGALVGWGVLAHAGVVMAAIRWPAGPLSPEIQRLRTVRQAMADDIDRWTAARAGQAASEACSVLTQGLERFDEEIVPPFRQLVDRKEDLRQHLSRYRAGRLPPPEMQMLDRVQAIYGHQQGAVDRCIQQAVNAEASLIALLQQEEEAALVMGLRAWAAGLADVHSGLADHLGRPSQEPPGITAEKEPFALPVVDDAEPSTEYSVGLAQQPGFVGLVEDALRHLNNLGRLSRSGLAGCLPETLRTVWQRSGQADGADPSVLDQSHAVRELIVEAIERLKVGDGEGTAQALQYHILREEYVLGMSTKHIIARHAISESTFHRYRHEAVRVLAAELATRERHRAE
jgi:hypothetical protein